MYVFLLIQLNKQAHNKTTRVKSLLPSNFQGQLQSRTGPGRHFAVPLMKAGLLKLSCSIHVSNQSDEIHLLRGGLNPDSSAHLIGNLIISGVDERKLELATERVGLLWDSCAFPLLCKSWASPTGWLEVLLKI